MRRCCLALLLPVPLAACASGSLSNPDIEGIKRRMVECRAKEAVGDPSFSIQKCMIDQADGTGWGPYIFSARDCPDSAGRSMSEQLHDPNCYFGEVTF
jgi:hypothetical protein